MRPALLVIDIQGAFFDLDQVTTQSSNKLSSPSTLRSGCSEASNSRSLPFSIWMLRSNSCLALTGLRCRIS